MEFHQPVLVPEVLHWMNLQDNGVYCDCTVGGGGHLRAMLEATSNARFIGIDWDPEAIAVARERTALYAKRLSLHQANFINLDLILESHNIRTVNGILFDFGVSYHQVTTPERGFSFEREGGLLMHMAPQTPSLAQKLKAASKHDLARVLRDFGDVRNSWRLAELIYANRAGLHTTIDLRNLVAETVPRRFLKKNLHRVFQALRIWVNDEMANVREGVARALRVMASGARLLAISYHSGEDRIVKVLLREQERAGGMTRLNKKVIRPSVPETTDNPSARSARLRVGERCAV
jgi:16S rRNA (cytosine1402-N4)-methyltransferase